MNHISRIMAAALLFVCVFPQGTAAQYQSYKELTSALQSLARQYPAVVSVASIARTQEGRDVWAVTVGKAPAHERKALLIVGGIEATALAGTHYAVEYLRSLAGGYGKIDSITQLLDKTTVYVIPRANPDGSESFWKSPQKEQTSNRDAYDDDRDAAVDEDDVDDLNKDGIISWMRVTDPRGEWIVHPADSRLMKKADPAKGERGVYRLLTEGIDNDRDEQWNEDPVGGTDLNRNFTYQYQFFGRQSGLHQMSAPEAKALADFVMDHPNIGMIFTFAPNDNLTAPWKNEPSKSEGPVITSVTKEDEPFFGAAAQRFTEVTGLKNAPKPVKGEGAFSEWAYYHAGRWSFAVRPWWAGEVPKPKDTSMVKESGRKAPESKKGENKEDDDADVRTLSWLDWAGVKQSSIPWTRIDHPDFPGKSVEIGGVKPFVMMNPPAESLAVYAVPYVKFLTFLPSLMPSVVLADHRIEKIGKNVYRLTVDVVNSGFLPTNNTLGVKTRWVRNVRVQIEPGNNAVLSSGKMKQVLDPISGSGGYATLRWVLVGSGKVRITAGSPTAGTDILSVELK